MPSSTAPVALVTGTSSGTGLSTCAFLAEAGYRVVATMREPRKSDALRARVPAAEVRQLDVQDDGSVATCLKDVLEAHGRIDVVVNNAGAGYLGTCEDTPLKDAQRVLDLNFFGVWRVTQAVLPVMRRQGSGRILAISSVGGLIGQPFNDAYCAAKFAVEGFFEALAPVAKRLGIHVSIIEPGAVNTEFVASVARDVAARPQPVSPPYQHMMAAYREATTAAFARGQTPDEVARVIVEVVQADAPHFRYVTSELVRGVVALKYVDPTGDSIVALSGSRLPSAAK
jgi:NAD(P)-dependent dehydrogenase (short-subunit alcohol dehydrogenase family)